MDSEPVVTIAVSELDRLRHKCGEDRPPLREVAEAWLSGNARTACDELHLRYPNYPGDDWFGNASNLFCEMSTVALERQS